MSIFTTATASSLGAVLDCDLNTGLQIGTGGTPTDNTTILNAFLALGTLANPVELIIDGGSLVSGLYLPTLGHASIRGLGWDTGFYQKTGGNNDTIHNGGATANVPTDPAAIGIPAPTTFGFNVMLSNFRINGNRGNGTTGNSTSGDPHGNGLSPATWYFGINLMNIKNIRIENVWLYDTATYAIRTSNCAEIVVVGCRFEAPSLAQNTDGYHLSGPHTNVRVDNCFFQTGDDAIALNAPEGYGGNITEVAVSNSIYNACPTGIRVYVGVGTTFTVSKVVMTNCTGTFQGHSLSYTCAVLLGNSQSGTRLVDQIQDFTISNCTFTVAGQGPIQIADSCGTVNIIGVTWKDPNPGNPIGFVTFVGQCNVSSLNLIGCKTYRSTLGNSATLGLNNSGINGSGSGQLSCTIGKLKFSGFDVDNESGQTYPAIANLLNMTSLTIGEVVVGDVDPTLVTELTNTFTGITAIQGAGLSQTGWQIPDANVAASTLYISATGANAGKLCIQHTLGTVVALG